MWLPRARPRPSSLVLGFAGNFEDEEEGRGRGRDANRIFRHVLGTSWHLPSERGCCRQRTPAEHRPRFEATAGLKPAPAAGTRDIAPHPWLGARVRNVAHPGEMSALGLPGVPGVLVLQVPAGSVLARSGLQKDDVIRSVHGAQTADVAALLQPAPALAAFQSVALGVSRQQKEMKLDSKR